MSFDDALTRIQGIGPEPSRRSKIRARKKETKQTLINELLRRQIAGKPTADKQIERRRQGLIDEMIQEQISRAQLEQQGLAEQQRLQQEILASQSQIEKEKAIRSGMIGDIQLDLLRQQARQGLSQTKVADIERERHQQALFADFPFLAPESKGPSTIDMQELPDGTIIATSKPGDPTEEQLEIQRQREEGVAKTRVSGTDFGSMGDLLDIQSKQIKLQRDTLGLKQAEARTDPFALFTLGGDRALALDDDQRRELTKNEGSFIEMMEALEKALKFVRKGNIPISGLTAEGVEAKQLEKMLLNIERGAQGAGANFTEKEMEIITDMIGTLSGPKAALLGPDIIEANLTRFRGIGVSRMTSKMTAVGFDPRKIEFTGPDGSVVEVDTMEAFIIKDLAEDPIAWKEFINSLSEG